LKSEKDGRLYKGFTSDLEKRLLQHNAGITTSTKGYRPWNIVYSEKFKTRIEAREREKFLKTGQGRDYLKKIITAA